MVRDLLTSSPESRRSSTEVATVGLAERVQALYANVVLGLIAEALAVAALAAALYDETLASLTPSLGGWIAYMAGIVFLRLGLTLQYRSRSGAALEARPLRWETLMTVGTLAAGCGWGAVALLAIPLASGLSEGVLALVLAVVAIVGVDVLQASRRATLAFVAPLAGLLALALVMAGGPARYAGALITLIFLGALVLVARLRNAELIAVLAARLHNERLLADLALADSVAREAQRDEQLVFESALVGIAVVRDGRIVRANRKLEEIFGYRRGTLQGASTRALYRNDAEWREALEYVDLDLSNAGTHDAEREFFRRDGTEIWCRYRGQAVDRADPAKGAIWVFEDLTDAKLAAEEILKSEEQLEAADAETRAVSLRLADAIDCVPDAFALFDSDDRLINCNQRYLDAFPGRPDRSALLGETYEELVMRAVRTGGSVPVEYRKDLPGWVAEVMRRHRQPASDDHVYQTYDGRWTQVRERRTSDGGTVALRTDITELKRVEEQVRHLAHHDPLTGLPNRRLLEDRMMQAMNLARRSGANVGVMLVDLDKFKDVNDRCGHEAGDAVLREVARRLRDSVRQVDTVARQGGDEFVVVLNELKRANDAARVAQKIINALAKPITIDRETFHVGASIGIALFPADASDADALLREADAAMYRAKSAGRGRFEFFGNLQRPEQGELPLA